MRTTLTLDDDVAAMLHRVAKERGISFKEAVNTALRAGLTTGVPEPRRFRMPTSNMGVVEGVDLVKALQLASELEDEEIIRKLELGK
jgi:hypothetical protein